jgi:hypothetical protein
LPVPPTVAVNCRESPAGSDPEFGLTEIVTGYKVMVALPDRVVSATLVTWIVTFCCAGTTAGAV